MKRNRSWAVYHKYTGKRVSRFFKSRGNAVAVADGDCVVLSTTPRIFEKTIFATASVVLF